MKLKNERQGMRERREFAEGERRHFRSLVLGWTDPDTGDRLTTHIRGGEELLGALERAGFEVLDRRDDVGAGDAGSHGVSVVSQVARRSSPRPERRN